MNFDKVKELIEIISKSPYTEFTYKGEFTVNANETFKLRIPASSISDVQSTIKVNAKAEGNVQYKGYEYQPVNQNMQNVAIIEPIKENVSSIFSKLSALTV